MDETWQEILKWLASALGLGAGGGAIWKTIDMLLKHRQTGSEFQHMKSKDLFALQTEHTERQAKEIEALQVRLDELQTKYVDVLKRLHVLEGTREAMESRYEMLVQHNKHLEEQLKQVLEQNQHFTQVEQLHLEEKKLLREERDRFAKLAVKLEQENIELTERCDKLEDLCDRMRRRLEMNGNEQPPKGGGRPEGREDKP